mmetsp:Transcript_32845/g.50194  ORF Transcript_32845/g.50194 Transcript_32845/m.50194 type:complete len:99 (+) Transcript_32845:2538-2834(+)
MKMVDNMKMEYNSNMRILNWQHQLQQKTKADDIHSVAFKDFVTVKKKFVQDRVVNKVKLALRQHFVKQIRAFSLMVPKKQTSQFIAQIKKPKRGMSLR